MNKTDIVLVAVAAVCGTACVVLFTNLNSERDRVQALETQVVQLQHDLQAQRPRTSDTATPPPSVPPSQDVAAQPAVVTARPTSPAPAATKPSLAEADDSRALMADPAYRKARLAEHRLQVQRGYPQIIAELGLSKDEAERFLDLLAEQSLRETESAIEKQPGDNLQQRWKQLQERADKERREFLGEERFRTWTEYVNSASARGFVNDLRTELATSSSPLRDEQIKPLVKALATEHQRQWAARWENRGNGEWTDETPLSERLAHMERRAALIEESLDRQQEVGVMNLDSVQQRQFNAMLDRQREQARADLASWRAFLEAEERRRAR